MFWRKRPRPTRETPLLEALEPRILYSADTAVPLAVLTLPDAPAETRALADYAALTPPLTQTPASTVRDAAAEDAAARSPGAPPPAADDHADATAVRTVHELIFIDRGVEDAQHLADQIRHAAGDHVLFDVIMLGDDDGMAQISRALAAAHDLGAVHIISHGSAGALELGEVRLDAARLAIDGAAVARWGQALAPGGDLLLYGCDVAQDAVGQAFVRQLALQSGADVAASSDRTGAAARGGDWSLEFTTGAIDSALTPATLDALHWGGVLATFTVRNINDAGTDSFRQAIIDANTNPGVDSIVFDIAGTGVHTITPLTALPTITGATLIDATTDDSFAANSNRPAIILDGNNLVADGLVLGANADGSTIRGLIIRDFGSSGIWVQPGADGNTIAGNYIGSLNASGTSAGAAEGNSLAGIRVQGSDNTIGGTSALDRNVLSGNGNSGLSFGGGSGNFALGNYIGVAADGTSAMGNAAHGVYVNGSDNNRIGGTAAGAGNVIANNQSDGVAIVAPATGNAVLANSIYSNTGSGIDLADDGITVNDSPVNKDSDTGANGLQNFPIVAIADSGATGTTILGNLNSNANTNYRIEFFANRPAVADGSNGEGERYLGFVNVNTNDSGTLSANFNVLLAGVWVNARDRITATATVDLGNGNYGSTSEFAANITATSSGVIVVDTTSDVANGNTSNMINLGETRGADGRISLREAILAANNTANGGTPDKIVFAIPNSDARHFHYVNDGVTGQVTAGNQTATTARSDAELVNADPDFAKSWWSIQLSPTILPTITQAVIIDASTQTGFSGTPIVEINAAAVSAGDPNAFTLTTGSVTLRGFVINRAGDDAIEVDIGGNGNTIVGNYLGTDVSGSIALGNGYGITVKTDSNVIGGTSPLDRNVISGNTSLGALSYGIGFWQDADNNIVEGNYIGVGADGVKALGNRQGITFQNTSDNNRIGGTAVGAGNVIANSTVNGIDVVAGVNNHFLGNAIYRNTSLGINLGTAGVTANDAGDGDSGANDLLNFPIITKVVQNGTNLDVTLVLDVPAGNYRIEMFQNPSGTDSSRYGEGQVFLGALSVTSTGSGAQTFIGTLNGVTATSITRISATATRDLGGGNYGNTSEFGPRAGLVVSTTSDTLDGTVTSVQALISNPGADGHISLREAITAANASGGIDYIYFDITAAPVGGVHTITVTGGALPLITDTLFIDGWSDPDYIATPVIELNGNATVGGLTLWAGSSGSTLRGLIINRFNSDGLLISNSNNQKIQGNWIGLDATGTASSANGARGVAVFNSSGNQIGGTTAAQRNVIAGNTRQSISFDAVTASTIAGNYIGTDAAGTGDLNGTTPNTEQSGVYLNNAIGNVIGGTTAAARNVISGNNHYGIELVGASSANNLLQGNYIGTNAVGAAALGNVSGGVTLWGSGAGNIVGGTADGAGNVISGNLGIGIQVANGSTGTTIQGNTIGLSANGSAALANGSDGIAVEGAATASTIGGSNASARNIISGNTANGIRIRDSGTVGIVVQGNYIGTDATGSAAIGNGGNGIRISNGATGNSVGGSTAGAGNLIANNTVGVVIKDATTSGNVVLGNSIRANTGPGIDLGADGVTANDGALTAGQPNLLMDHPVFSSAQLVGTTLTVSGYIGTAPGDTDFANARVEIFRSSNDLSGFGEGQSYLDFLTADASGNFSGSLTVVGFTATDRITGTATDGSGNTSEFGPNADIDAAPVNTVPAAQVVAEDTALGLSGLSVTDLDGNLATVRLAVGQGTLTVTLSGAARISAGANGTGTLTLSGVQGDLNATLATLSYQGTFNYSGSDTLTVTSTDAASMTDVDTVAITVTAVNDAPSFEVGTGRTTTPFAAGTWDLINASALQPDGKIVAVGYTQTGATKDIAVARYNADGSLDTSFGGGTGKVTTVIGASDDIGKGVCLLADGRILVAGTTYTGTSWDMVLVQYNADGSLDSSFGGGDGIVTSGTAFNDEGNGVAVQSDGKLLVAGTYGVDFGLARFNSNGSLDTSFGTSGFVATDFAAGTDGAYSIALQADGRIVLGGFAFSGTSFDFALARYHSNGTLDTTFNGTGKVLTDLGATSSDTGYQIALQPDGRILLAGWSDAGGTNDFALVRYNSDGSLDTTFNSTGKVTTGIGTGADLGISVAVQSDGKILVAGHSSTAGNNFAVVRYNANGSLDTSFGAGTGKVDTNFGGSSDDRGASVLVQTDGKIVVAGTSTIGGDYDFAVVRYNSDGTLDSRFNTRDSLGGTIAYTEKATAVVLDNDVTIFDAELSTLNNFSGSTLTLVRNGGATSQDVYSATGMLAALTQGSNLVFNGTTIGTVTTNSGGTLLLTFNAGATRTLVESAMRAIAYANNSSAPPASVQIGWTFNDGNTGAQGSGGALTATGNTTVNITAVNDAPTITNLSGDSLAYSEGGGAVVIEQGGNAVVVDVDSPDFNTGTLTVSFTAGSDGAEDVLGIRNQGTGVGQIGVGGSNVTYQGVTIGTFAGGGSGTNLVITFNASATPTAVTALIQNITYQDTDTNAPTTGARSVRYVLTDGDGGSSANYDTTVTVSGVNDAPVAAGGSVTGVEDTPFVFSWLDFDISDVDSPITDDTAIQITTLSADGILQVSNGFSWEPVTEGQPITKATIDAGWLRFVPDLNESGNDAYPTPGVGHLRQDYAQFSYRPAQTIAITNPDAELGITYPEGTGNNVATGWNISGTVYTSNFSSGAYPNDHDQVFSLSQGAQMSQVLGATFSTTLDYDLSVDVGWHPAWFTPQFQVALWAGGTRLGFINESSITPVMGEFVRATLSVDGGAFSAVDGQPLEIRLLNASGFPNVAQFDNVLLTATPGGLGAAATLNIDIASINDPPILDLDADNSSGASGPNYSTSFTEGAGAVTIVDADATLTDVDDTLLTGLTASIDARYDGASEGLTANVTGTSITASYDANSGVLTLSGSDTVAHYEQVLRTIRYQNTSDDPTTTARTIYIRAEDGVAYSNDGTVNLTVVAVNDAPVLTSIAPTLTTINENQTNHAGQTVASLVGASISDADSGAQQGIAITALVSGNGSWQYSLNGGSTWTTVGAVSNGSALLLGVTDMVRFVPDGQNGTTASVSYRAWDRTDAGSAGSKVDTAVNGGSGAFSSAFDTATITVIAVNDAPILSGANNLAPIDEDPAANPGTLVSTLIAGHVSDVDSGAQSGIAVVAVDNSHGDWQFSTDGGANWIAFGTPSDALARLLAADAQTFVRFVPNSNWNGTASNGLTFRAWDQSSGIAGAVADISSNGGTTAFSSASVSAGIVVNAVNDGPGIAVPIAQSTNEDTALLFNDANGNRIIISDDAGEVLHVSLSVGHGTLTLTQTTGLTFSSGVNGDEAFKISGSVENINAALDGLRYQPTGNYNGSDTLSITARDETVYQLDIDASLLGHYTFEAAAPGDDSSPAGTADATLLGNAAIVGDPTHGDVLLLDGDFDHASIAGIFGGPANLTLAAWVNLASTDTNGAQVIQISNRAGLRLDSPTGQMVGYFYNGSAYDSVYFGITLAGSGWRHVALTFNDTANLATLYIDGAAVTSKTITNSINYSGASNFTRIGGLGATAGYDFNGKIDEARIYNRALTATEIATLAADLSMTDTDTVTITVTAVNDSPTIGGASLPGVAEDTINPPGETIAALFGPSFNDPDAGATLAGIAVTFNPLETLQGMWQYSTNGGANWIDVGNIVAANAALALDAATRLRFLPAADFNGAPTGLSLRALDDSYLGGFSVGAAKVTLDTSSPGGTSSVSTSLESLGTTVTAVNDAPVAADDRLAVSFDGIDDVVAVADSASLNVNATLTLEAWVNPDRSSNAEQIIVNKEGEYELAIFYDGSLRFAVAEGGTWNWRDSGAIIARNTWTHVALTYDAGVVTTYVNGVAINTQSMATTTIDDVYPAFNELRIGGRSNSPAGQYFDGGIADVRVWNVARSAAEIAGAMNSTLSGGESGLAAYLPLNDNLGSSAADNTANGNNGTLLNGAAWAGFRMTEDGVLNAALPGVLGNDYDADGDALTAVLVSGPAHGNLTLNPDGSFVYASTADWTGTDYFTYRANDGTVDGNVATVRILVDPANDAPVVDLNGGVAGNDVTTAFTEQTPVLIAPAATLSDVDSATSSSLTVTLTTRPDGDGVESLSLNAAATTAANGAGLTVGYTAGTGVLSITGVATTAVYKSILQGIVYDNASDAPTTTDRSITVVANDGALPSTTQTVTLTMTAVNDAPVLDLNGGTAGSDVTTAFTEQTPVLIAPTATSSDVDSATLSSLTVTLTARPDGDGVESLSLNAAATTAANGAGLTVGYTAGTGVLSITGVATTAVYQAILQGIVYDDTSDTPTTVDRTITVVANDGALPSTTQTVTLTVAAANDAPVNTVPATSTVAEDSALAMIGANLITVTDVDGNLASTRLTVTQGTVSVTLSGAASISAGANGSNTLTLSGTETDINATLASLIYQGNLNYAGPDTLTTVSTDGAGAPLSDVDVTVITVTAVDDDPTVSAPSNATTVENGSLVFNAGGAGVIDVADVDSASLTLTLTADHAALTLAQTTGLTLLDADGSDGSLRFSGSQAALNAALAGLGYLSQPGYHGTASLIVLADDGAATASKTVAINVTPGTSTFVWDGGGATNDWSDAFNWNFDLLPDAQDIAVFNATSSKHATVDAAFAGAVGQFRIDAGYTGIITLGRALQVQGDFSQAAGTLTTAGYLFDVDGAVARTGGLLNLGATRWQVGGDFANTASINSNSSTLVFDGAGNQSFSSAAPLASVEVAKTGGGLTLNSDLAVFADFKHTSGAVDFAGQRLRLIGSNLQTVDAAALTLAGLQIDNGSGTINVVGTLDVDGLLDIVSAVIFNGGTINAGGDVRAIDAVITGTGTLRLDGIGNQRVDSGGANATYAITNLIIDKAGGTATLQDTMALFGNLLVTQGTVDATGLNLRLSGVTAGAVDADIGPVASLTFASPSSKSIDGTLTVNGLTRVSSLNAFTAGSVRMLGDADFVDAAFSGNGTFELAGAANQAISAGAGGMVRNLIVNKSGGTASVTQDLAIEGGFLHTAGTFDASTITTSFRGAGLLLDTAGITFGNVSFTNNANFTLGSDLTVGGDLNLLSVAGTNSGANLHVAGNVSSSDASVSGNVGLILYGTANQTIAGADLFDGTLTVNKASGSVTLADDLVLNGPTQNVVVQSGTLALNGQTIDLPGTVTINGGTLAGSGAITHALNVQGGSVLLAASAPANHQQIDVGGALTLGAASQLRLDIAGNTGGGALANLLTAASRTGTFNTTMLINDGVGFTAHALDTPTSAGMFLNTAPSGALADVVVDEDAAATVIDLDAAFGDAQHSDAQLSYTVTGNTNPALFTSTSVTGGTLILNLAANQNGTAQLSVRATDPYGASHVASFNVTVNAVNDAPIATGAASLAAVPEDSLSPGGATVSSLFSANFSDPADAGNPTQHQFIGVAVRGQSVNAAHGRWQYSVDGGGSWSNFGALSDTNALALGTADLIRFLPAADFNGTPTSLTVRLIDNSFDAFTGGALVGGATVDANPSGGTTPYSGTTVTLGTDISAVNDAPTATITPLTYSATEQTNLALQGTGLSIADGDAGSATVQATLSVINGTLTATAGTTGVTISGSGTNSVTLSGTLTQINTLLAGTLGGTLNYLQSSDTPPATDTLTLTASDLGNTGTGGTLTGVDTATINLTAVNDAPVNTVPGAQTVNEDQSLAFSNANGNLIAISDVDAGGNAVQVTLTGTHGTVTLAGLTGLGFTVGDGVDDATMTFTGAIANINAALAGMHFQPAADFNGAASIQIVTNDQGNTGAAGPRSTSDTVAITVAAQNDAPIVDLNGVAAGNGETTAFIEQTPVSIAPTGTLSDVDSATLDALRVTLTARPDGDGVESLSLNAAATTAANGAGLTVSYTAGTGVLSITGVATTAVYESILQGIVYDNASDAPTTTDRSITVVVNDGALSSATQTVTLTMTAVNDAPRGTSATVTTDEDTSYTFTVANFGFSDPSDVSAHALAAVRITTLPLTGSLTLNDVAVTMGQSISVAEVAAGRLAFEPAAQANGLGYASFTFQVQDTGGTVNGGVDLDPTPRTLTIDVTAVNDAPTGSVLIQGTPEVGQVLGAVADGVGDADGLGVFQFQWLRDGAPIEGATGTSYQVQASDTGARLGLAVRYTDQAGSFEVLESAATATVTAAASTAVPPTASVWALLPEGSGPTDYASNAPDVLDAAYVPTRAAEADAAFEPDAGRGAPFAPGDSAPAPTPTSTPTSSDFVRLLRALAAPDLNPPPHLGAPRATPTAADRATAYRDLLALLNWTWTATDATDIAVVSSPQWRGLTVLPPAETPPAQHFEFSVDSLRQVAGLTLSAGFVVWTLRSGGLLFSLMSSLPAWRNFDLLPVLAKDDEAPAWVNAENADARDEERALAKLRRVQAHESPEEFAS